MAVPFVQSVFHPTDFSSASEKAFMHALVVSLNRKTSLTLLNVVGPDEAMDLFHEFPGVRQYLEKWGLLPEGSHRSDVYGKLGVKVRKVNLRSGNVYKAALEYLKRHPNDLMVLSTKTSFKKPEVSIAQKLSRTSKTMTLFVPESARGFVDRENGSVNVRRIMVAVDTKPVPKAAMTYAMRAAQAFAGNDDPAEITLVHVGEQYDFATYTSENGSFQMKNKLLDGPVVSALTDEVREGNYDLVIMTTEGRNGILDIFKGSVTEQILKGIEAPLLAVPATMLEDF